MIRSFVSWLPAIWLGQSVAQELTPAEHAKVFGELHGVIQDRLPVQVMISFETPPVPTERIRTEEDLAAYARSARTPLLTRLAGPGFYPDHEYPDHEFRLLNTFNATISTPEALARVLSDPAVKVVSGVNEGIRIQGFHDPPL